MKNAYAKKLQANRFALQNQERLRVIQRTLTTIYQASALALNQEFGFGPDRTEKFRDATDAIVNEYGGLVSDVDADYADGKLERAFVKLMGERRN